MSKNNIRDILVKQGIGIVIVILFYLILGFFKDSHILAEWLFSFFLANIVLLIAIMILELLAEVFETFRFPLNLPFPFFKALAITAGVSFMSNFIENVIIIYDLMLALKISSAAIYVYRIVFVVVLIFSLLKLFKGRGKVNEK